MLKQSKLYWVTLYSTHVNGLGIMKAKKYMGCYVSSGLIYNLNDDK